jgi:hypothetical protein
VAQQQIEILSMPQRLLERAGVKWREHLRKDRIEKDFHLVDKAGHGLCAGKGWFTPLAGFRYEG